MLFWGKLYVSKVMVFFGLATSSGCLRLLPKDSWDGLITPRDPCEEKQI